MDHASVSAPRLVPCVDGHGAHTWEGAAGARHGSPPLQEPLVRQGLLLFDKAALQEAVAPVPPLGGCAVNSVKQIYVRTQRQGWQSEQLPVCCLAQAEKA